jgi:hypothetical protein
VEPRRQAHDQIDRVFADADHVPLSRRHDSVSA